MGFTRRDGTYPFLCEGCALNALEPYEAGVGAGKVERAESESRGIGTATTELGIVINSCRRSRSRGECDDPSKTSGMAELMLTSSGQPITRADFADSQQPRNLHIAVTWPDFKG